MDIRFGCTQCGRCCHDLKLPLSVAEAIAWAERGDVVELLCDARPHTASDASDAGDRYRADRAFVARSGTLEMQVAVVLVASHVGPCPNLQPDMLCAIYDERPRTCRLYPVEVVPGLALAPENKACPPEAWGIDQPLLIGSGELVSADIRASVDAQRQAIRADAPVKAIACGLLGIATAAFANEGYAVHTPAPAALADALRRARSVGATAAPDRGWSVITNRRATEQLLRDAGANTVLQRSGPGYLSFFADEP